MQRGRSTLDSFPEPMDLNQESLSSNTAMNQSSPMENLLNPVENRLSNHMLSSDERSISCTSTSSHNARSFSGWDRGESSSNSSVQERIYEDNMKLGHVWTTAISGRANPDLRLQASTPEPSSVYHRECENIYGGNHMTRRVQNMPDSGSNVLPLNTDICGGYIANNDAGGQGTGAGASNYYWPGRSETSTYGTSSDAFGVSSGSSGYMVENGDGSGSSSGAWGSSCKRKALEGSHAQAYPGGSSSSNPPAEVIDRHTFPARFNASSGINISSSPVNGSSSQPQQMNSRNGGGMRTTSEIFPPLSMSGITESSAGNVNGRLLFGPQEPDFFGLPFIEAALRPPPSSSSSHQPSRSFTATGSPMLMNPSNNSLNQPHITTHVPGFARSMSPFPWNGSLDSQGGSSDSFMFSGNRGAAFRDESNSRSSLRNNLENPAFASASASESRTLVQDPTTWNLTPGNTRSSRNGPSSSRSGPSSSIRTLPTVWTPHQNPTTHNQQGITEYAPWTLFPPPEPEYGVQRGLLPVMPTASASEDAVMLSSSSRRRHQHYSRSPLLMDATGDAITGWRALADMEGRHRLIRQVLNAVRRGDNLRAQDFTVFDPFISELQDRHSNMRLDVDNMSYEELLALEEHIGNVSTGLSEAIIMQSMKQRNYHSVGTSSNSEPCCICQEEYVFADEVGTLDCAHEFHTNCIKQWLLLKNLCPICKMTALKT